MWEGSRRHGRGWHPEIIKDTVTGFSADAPTVTGGGEGFRKALGKPIRSQDDGSCRSKYSVRAGQEPHLRHEND
jgi:hypothetical protein